MLTIFVFEPCQRVGKHRILIAFLIILMCYNFFGGLILWRNQSGDYFYHKTSWIRQELTEKDTVLFNMHDNRIVDYVMYYSDVRVVYLTGEDEITVGRNTPGIYCTSIEQFLASIEYGDKLYVLEDVLAPDPAIKNCRYGQHRYDIAVQLAERLVGSSQLVNEGLFGKTYEVTLRNSRHHAVHASKR